jgi:Fic family protein
MIWNWQTEDWPHWQYNTNTLAEYEQQFLVQAGQLMGAWQHISTKNQTDIKVQLLSDEALKTSAIEGEYLDRSSVQSSIQHAFGLSSKPTPKRPNEDGIAQLMTDCYQNFSAPLTQDMLYQWHELVCQTHTDLNFIGTYRQHPTPMQVVSGPINKRKVHFEAPPAEKIHQEMDDFIQWYQTKTIPALAKAGLAHLYFVSIHPFEDGNGRISRALAEKSLSQSLGQPTLLALSHQISIERKQYYQSLADNNQQMEVTPWITWFAQTVLKAQKYSLALIEHTIRKTQLFDRLADTLNPRQTKVLLRMFASGPDGFEGGLSSKNYQKIADSTTATTTRDLRDLVAKGALTKTGVNRGTRYWLVSKRKQSWQQWENDLPTLQLSTQNQTDLDKALGSENSNQNFSVDQIMQMTDPQTDV